MKRRAFTLIEVLVSGFLGLFLIAALIQLTFFSKQKERVSSRVASSAIAWLEAKQQLEESLALAEPWANGDSAVLPGLYFTFENGIDIDPAFCGRRGARIWEDTKALHLTVFGEGKERTRTLWRGQGPITFTLWNGIKKMSVQSARIDRTIRAVIIRLGSEELICPLHSASIREIL